MQLPESIQRLVNLEVLKVENNELRVLPSSIGTFLLIAYDDISKVIP